MPLRRTTQRKYESSNGNIDQNGNATVCEKEKKRTVINNYITFTYKLIFTITAEILVLSLANFFKFRLFYTTECHISKCPKHALEVYN